MPNTPRHIWRHIYWSKALEFEDEPVRSCFLSKVLHYSTWRNAYENRESTNLEPAGVSDSYALEHETLKRRIEKERVRGTKFILNELPAIALMGKKIDLLLTDSWWEPFEDVRFDGVSGKTMAELGNAIKSSTSWSGSAFLTTRGSAPIPILPYRRYVSKSVGRMAPLMWNPCNHRVRLGPVSALVSHIATQLNGAN
jgi:hypothetical protein